MGEEADSIEEAVAARKERLRALRAAQELSSAPDDDASDHENENQNGDDDAG